MNTSSRSSSPVGTFCLVLHSHLPWLAHHGSWPVGEEWLYQAWANSYLPVFDVLSKRASRGETNLVTLGVTPVLAAALDDGYTIDQCRNWMWNWSARADELHNSRTRAMRELGHYESSIARERIRMFDRHWQSGGSNPIRALTDARAIELLSGPLTHPFQPLLDDRIASFALNAGLDDATIRFGTRPTGIWAPECGYRPGLEDIYSEAGVSHFMVDGPTLQHVGRSTADAWMVGDSDVVAFGRDLDVTYRVWSPRRGYPGGPWYRDFHAHDHDSGFRPSRVTSARTPSHEKAPYDPAAANGAVLRDADDFVRTVLNRFAQLRGERDGKPGLIVAAYDTELFGHWWHEGPQWLDEILTRLPRAGVEVTTLSQAIDNGAVAGRTDLGASSWGSGKDFSVWQGDAVADMVADNDNLQMRWIKIAQDDASRREVSREALNQLAQNALLALSSDWAFMVTKDSAAEYARSRHSNHHREFHALASEIEASVDGSATARQRAEELARDHAQRNRPFGRINAALLMQPEFID